MDNPEILAELLKLKAELFTSFRKLRKRADGVKVARYMEFRAALESMGESVDNFPVAVSKKISKVTSFTEGAYASNPNLAWDLRRRI